MKKVDLTTGNVAKSITSLALPIMGSSLLQLTYNFIDMLWVGSLGSDSVASIGTASFFIGLGHSISSMVIIGTGIKVAHSVGKKDEKEVREYLNAGLFLNLIIGLLYGSILLILGKNFIGFFNIGSSTVERDGYLYLALSSPMLFFSFYNLLYTRILGSFGNNKSALKISVIGVVINMILDPILIYIFKLGVSGAAIATLIANIAMFILFNIKGKDILRYSPNEGLSINKTIKIIILGFPMAFQRCLFTVVNIILAKIIATFGANAIAAQKIGLQIESITFMVIGGLNGAVSSFVGQNYGAFKLERVKEGYKVSLIIGLIYSLMASAIFILFSEELARLFVREEETIKIASDYLKIVGVSQVFSAVEMISNGLFTGIGEPKISAIISIIFTVIRIPMALIFTKYIGIFGIWWSISLSSILKGISAYSMYVIKIWRVDKKCYIK
ncbi:MATE family efflux transporter [Clostridium carnis]